MANALLLPQNREKLARVIKPLVKESKVIGLPAILGLYRTQEVIAHLEELIGVPVFEIPTIPPSVPGIAQTKSHAADGAILFFDQGFEGKINRSRPL